MMTHVLSIGPRSATCRIARNLLRIGRSITSQEFADRAEFLSDFKAWAKFCDGSPTGYQFGYPADRKWWSQIGNPPLELGAQIHRGIPSCRYLFWVDFTADKVRFREK
jgi:hypothetical protein